MQNQASDHESGLHYNYHRYYDPATGRYLTPDPIGFAGQDFNLFPYTANNPINFVDPFGLYTNICVEFSARGIKHVWADVNGTKRGFYSENKKPFDDGVIKDDSYPSGSCREVKLPNCASCSQAKFDQCMLRKLPLGETSERYNIFTKNCGAFLYDAIAECREECCNCN